MKRNLILMTLVILTSSSIAENTYGDEAWKTEEYPVIYTEDRNNTAIWSYGDGQGTIFIDGLAGEVKNRSSYNGYWVQESSSLRCDTYREGMDGKPSYHWGRFEIKFLNPDLPSYWQAKFGLCDQEPSITLNGTPIKSNLPE